MDREKGAEGALTQETDSFISVPERCGDLGPGVVPLRSRAGPGRRDLVAQGGRLRASRLPLSTGPEKSMFKRAIGEAVVS